LRRRAAAYLVVALAACGGGDSLGFTSSTVLEDSSAELGEVYYYWVRAGDGTTWSGWNGPDAGSAGVGQCADGADNDADGLVRLSR